MKEILVPFYLYPISFKNINKGGVNRQLNYIMAQNKVFLIIWVETGTISDRGYNRKSIGPILSKLCEKNYDY